METENMSYEWVKGNIQSAMPKNAVIICGDKDGSSVYFGQCTIGNQVLGVKIVAKRKQAYVAYNGLEKPVTNFNVSNCKFIFIFILTGVEGFSE